MKYCLLNGEMLISNPEGQPLRVFALRLRGTFFAQCRRWNEAIADLSQAVELDASHEDSAFQLSVLLLEGFCALRIASICRHVQRQLMRNELARFYHHRTRNCLPPKKLRRDIQ